MSWIEAVKAYAIEKGSTFKLPKKNTPEYEAIKVIQMKLKEGATVSEKPLKKVKAVKTENPEPVVAVEVPVATVQKVRKATSPKHENVAPAPVEEVIEPKKRVRKVKEVIKVQNPEPIIITEEVVPDKKVKKVKNVKVPNVVPVEAEPDVKPDIKLPKQTRKEAKATKIKTVSETQEKNSKTAGKKALDDARLIILDKPISFRFD